MVSQRLNPVCDSSGVADDLPSLRARLVLAAAERAAVYARDRRLAGVSASAVAVAALDRLTSTLPDGPADPAAVLAELDALASPATMYTTGGRFFGFVNGGTDPAAAGAAVLAGAWDQNIGTPAMSPAAAHIDAIAARWVCELLGLPASAVATFCSGASIANLSAAIAARDALLARLGWEVAERGLSGALPLRVVASAEAHASVLRALRVAGFGSASIELAPTDRCGRVDPRTFPSTDDRTLVVLQAGNVNTGHSDPFAELIPAARDAGAWVHVDGAFGLWAAASERRRWLVDGVDLADSWATDAHKWLNAPYDSGIAIYARGEDALRAFAIAAAYLPASDQRDLLHLGLQMSQRARAVDAWAVIASQGRSGIARMIDGCCDHAARFAEILVADGVELLAPVALNQALVRFGDDEQTARVIAGVQAEGTCWAGGTRWQGRDAMRISVSDVATTTEDVARSAAAMIRVWRSLS